MLFVIIFDNEKLWVKVMLVALFSGKVVTGLQSHGIPQ